MWFLLFPSLPFLYSSRPFFPQLFFSSRPFSFLFFCFRHTIFFLLFSLSLTLCQSIIFQLYTYLFLSSPLYPSFTFSITSPSPPLFAIYETSHSINKLHIQNLPAQYRHKDCLYFLFKWFKFSPLRICISECLFGPPACNHIGAGMRFLFPTIIHKTRHITFQLYHIISYDTV